MARQMQKLEDCPQEVRTAAWPSWCPVWSCCLSSVSYTTSVCVKRTLSIVSFFILLSINLEIIGSLMHADKDLFIRGYFFLCATSIYLSSKILVATIRDKIIRPTISVSTFQRCACLMIVPASCTLPEFISLSNSCTAWGINSTRIIPCSECISTWIFAGAATHNQIHTGMSTSVQHHMIPGVHSWIQHASARKIFILESTNRSK